MKIDHKTVLITGASSGIGWELAKQLDKKKCKLILIARRQKRLEELCNQLTGEPCIYVCDVSSQEQVNHVCEKLGQESVPDIFIFNAGLSDRFDLNQINAGNIEYIFRVHLFSVVYFLQNLMPYLLKRNQGMIAAISSLAGYRGMPGAAPYSASKAALSTFLSSLRIDLWHTGIHVSVISPGFVKTPLTDKNEFYMPFMLPVEKAGRIIVRGLEKEKNEIHFPYRLSIPAKLMRLLPDSIYSGLMQGRRK